jgi:hypothetical protein
MHMQVRVGSERAPILQRARDVWVTGLINHRVNMHLGEWQTRVHESGVLVTQLSATIHALQEALGRAEGVRPFFTL